MHAIVALPCPDSPLRRLDPRWKLAGLLGAAGVVVFLQTLPGVTLALFGALVLACLGRLPRRWCLARLGTTALVLAPFLLLLPFVHRDTGTTLDVLGVRVSVEGLRLALLVAVKTLALALLLLVLLATEPLLETLKAAHALRIPGVLVQVAALTYRYTFVLGAELERLRTALRVRGYRNRLSLHSYRTAGHVAGTLLVRGYEQAERVGHAMRCRGFDGEYRTLTEYKTRPADVLACAAIVAYAAGLLTIDLWGR